MSSGEGTPISSSSAALQSMIYARLATLEESSDIGSRGNKSSINDRKNDVETIIDEITSAASITLMDADFSSINGSFHAAVGSASSPSAVRDIFEQEQQKLANNASSMKKKITLYKSRKNDCDKLLADTYRMKDGITYYNSQLQDLTELCRKLQTLSKEKIESNSKLVNGEREKTAKIEKECSDSLNSVGEKIQAEETDIVSKEAENEDLRAKLEQFKSHLDLQREKLSNEARTKDLIAQLEEAKLAQKNYYAQQDMMRRDACRSKIIHSQETVHQLEQQLLVYNSKFGEFEETLSRSNDVLKELEGREGLLQEAVNKLQAENADWQSRAAQANVNLISAVDRQKKQELELKATQQQVQKAEKKCRQLQARRKDRGGAGGLKPEVSNGIHGGISHNNSTAATNTNSANSPPSSSSSSPSRPGKASYYSRNNGGVGGDDEEEEHLVGEGSPLSPSDRKTSTSTAPAPTAPVSSPSSSSLLK
mmetsp:Transcript_16621/g.28134  ORF Transcript_16621/g.28134 Transcript_16621/m.28134 type:complete len:480 (+) Transcript_16621:32-1471(+)